VELPLDHVAIAVPSLDTSLPLFEVIIGAPGSPRERVESQGVDIAWIGTGEVRLELLEPIRADSPVGRFLERKGAGLHHFAYRVADLAETLRTLERSGVELVDREPRVGAHGRRIAFIHPRATGGILIELVEGPAPAG
jgi:methylmalonyl-CoA epimerase